MELAVVFKLSIYILTGFVGLALGFAEQGVIPFFSVPLTIFGYWWCEIGTRQGTFSRRGMGETPARVMGFIALVAATVEFFGNSLEGRLLSGIHLVVYLTWIVLLQQKSNYRYWLLMALTMMHVAVGSVLTNATWYGFCMVIFLFGSIWTLSVFSLYRAAQDFAVVDPDGRNRLIVDTNSTATGNVFNAIRFENDAQWISGRLFSAVTITSLAGLTTGALFFLLIPRAWERADFGISDDALPPALRRVTGLATEIRLGDMGPILASNDPVLQFKLFDNQTDRPLEPQTYAEWLGLREPLFRGMVLPDYFNGKWIPYREWITISMPQKQDQQPHVFDKPMVRQEIRLENIGSKVLPCMGKAEAMWDQEGYRCGVMQTNGIVVRRQRYENHVGAMVYTAYSVLPSTESRNDPGILLDSKERNSQVRRKYLERCVELPKNLSRLRELANQLVDAEAKRTGQPLTDVQKAKTLESYLRDSGEFQYSLATNVVDSKVDPVEDFLFRLRAGHCQYFASALALMFRSVGIPAQLVTGFKGGEVLADGTLNVEKRYSHVWVEAWIENRKWMTFDATPEDGRAQSVNEIGTKRGLWTSITSQLAGLWETNVLTISLDRQNEVIYGPIQEQFQELVKYAQAFSNSPRSSLISMLATILDPRNWLTIRGAIVLSLLIGTLWLLRKKTNLFRRIWGSKKDIASEKAYQRVEFYERFTALMRSQGWTRKQTQTQEEFVQEITGKLSQRLSNPEFNSGVQSIGQLFYRVRFGAEELSTHEVTRLDALLASLERALGSLPEAHPQNA